MVPAPVAFIPPIMQPGSPRNVVVQPFFSQVASPHRVSQQIVHKSAIISPIQSTIVAPQQTKAPKFTVEVIPGKVYPQKSSTIFKQSVVSKANNSES